MFPDHVYVEKPKSLSKQSSNKLKPNINKQTCRREGKQVYTNKVRSSFTRASRKDFGGSSATLGSKSALSAEAAEDETLGNLKAPSTLALSQLLIFGRENRLTTFMISPTTKTLNITPPSGSKIMNQDAFNIMLKCNLKPNSTMINKLLQD